MVTVMALAMAIALVLVSRGVCRRRIDRKTKGPGGGACRRGLPKELCVAYVFLEMGSQ